MKHAVAQGTAYLEQEGWAVVEATHGGIIFGRWAGGSRNFVDGTLHAALDINSPAEGLFILPFQGGLVSIPNDSIRAVRQVGKLLNSAIEVDYVEDGSPDTFTLVGPTKSMRRLFSALGRSV